MIFSMTRGLRTKGTHLRLDLTWPDDYNEQRQPQLRIRLQSPVLARLNWCPTTESGGLPHCRCQPSPWPRVFTASFELFRSTSELEIPPPKAVVDSAWWRWFSGGSDLVSRHRHQGRDYMPLPTRDREKARGAFASPFFFQTNATLSSRSWWLLLW